MNFAEALLHLNTREHRLSRTGWEGSGKLWVVGMSALSLPPYSTQEPGAKVNDRTARWIGEDTPLEVQPYYSLYLDGNRWQPGWTPDVLDMNADDWFVVA